MEHAITSSTQLGITVLRVSLDVLWIAHALLKLFVFTLPGTAQYFVSIGFPGVLAYPVFAAELLGGIALLLGIYARQAALALVPVMAVAAWVHAPNGWVHTSTGGGWEYPVFLVAASIALWLFGTLCIALCGLWSAGLGRSAALLFLPIAGLLAAKRRLAAHPDPAATVPPELCRGSLGDGAVAIKRSSLLAPVHLLPNLVGNK